MRILCTGTLLAVAFLGAACSKLTEPPKPEPTEVNPTGSAEPKNAGADRAQKVAEALASASAAKQAEPPPAPPTNEKLETKDVTVGKGAEAKAGDTVTVHYVGTLADGKEFDSSKKHGQPFTFELGAGKVIK